MSFTISLFAGILFFFQYTSPDVHTDFGMSWFGARSLLRHVDPYPLVGRGREFNFGGPLTYPVPAFVALIPITFFSEQLAGSIFVGLSVFLLALGITRKGWFLLPLFMTEPFLNAVRLGQWNIVLTAAIYFPLLGFLFPVKPQAVLPILVASERSKIWIAAMIGGAVLIILSTILMPHWIVEWLASVKQMPDSRPPILRFGGFLILLVLLRWRRSDAWLILSLACVPQTAAYYSTLPLFTIPGSFVESIALVVISAAGVVLASEFMPQSIQSVDALMGYLGSFHVWTIYLPVVVMVLRRPATRVGSPFWLRSMASQPS